MYFKKYVIPALLILLVSIGSKGQVAVKTNLLYDATTTPNLGIEIRTESRSTINLVYGYNPWQFNSKRSGEKKVKHWVLMPEYRWWLCMPFNGHFFGVHAFCGQANAANVTLPVPGAFISGDNLTKELRNNRYQGTFGGCGITYGYQWMLSRHWNFEAEVGLGYGYMHYDKYPCGECGTKLKSGGSNYLGITKLGLSIMYIF